MNSSLFFGFDKASYKIVIKKSVKTGYEGQKKCSAMSEGAIGDEFTSSEEKPKHHNEDLRYANGQRWKI